jgi:hypothetical protein
MFSGLMIYLTLIGIPLVSGMVPDSLQNTNMGNMPTGFAFFFSALYIPTTRLTTFWVILAIAAQNPFVVGKLKGSNTLIALFFSHNILPPYCTFK